MVVILSTAPVNADAVRQPARAEVAAADELDQSAPAHVGADDANGVRP
jgi:hypothetical protein